MNPSPLRCLVFAAGLLFSAGFSQAAPPAMSAPTATAKAANPSERTKQRIDALLKRRLKPEPLPANLPNPFQVGGGVSNSKRPDGSDSDSPAGGDTANAPGAHQTEALPPDSDSEALARYAAGLKISGIVQLSGRIQLIINQSSYKEGDLIFVDNKDAVTYLQIIRITPSELTLGFREAVLTLPLKY